MAKEGRLEVIRCPGIPRRGRVRGSILGVVVSLLLFFLAPFLVLIAIESVPEDLEAEPVTVPPAQELSQSAELAEVVVEPQPDPPPPDLDIPPDRTAPPIDRRLDPQMAQAQLPNLDLQDSQIDFQSESRIYEIGDLTETPYILVEGTRRYPDALENQGIKQGVVELEAVVDEQGRVRVLKVLSSDHPLLNRAAIEFAETTRLSPPKIDGQVVQVRFVFAVELRAVES